MLCEIEISLSCVLPVAVCWTRHGKTKQHSLHLCTLPTKHAVYAHVWQHAVSGINRRMISLVTVCRCCEMCFDLSMAHSHQLTHSLTHSPRTSRIGLMLSITEAVQANAPTSSAMGILLLRSCSAAAAPVLLLLLLLIADL